MSGGFPMHGQTCNWYDIANDAGLTTYGNPTACGNGVKGSWFQLTASTPSDIEAFQIYALGPQNFLFTSLIDIGIGPSGSEIPIINNFFAPSNTGQQALIASPVLPISIPAGTRIAARAQAPGSGEATIVTLRVADGDFMQSGFAGVDGIGADTTNTRGVLATTGAASTKGSWAQIVASAARDYDGFFLTPGPQSGSDGVNAASPIYIDIGIGASGSEQIIVPDIMGGSLAQNAQPNIPATLFWVPIPAGTRIALRFSSSTATVTKSFVVNGIYR